MDNTKTNKQRNTKWPGFTEMLLTQAGVAGQIRPVNYSVLTSDLVQPFHFWDEETEPRKFTWLRQFHKAGEKRSQE